MIKPSKVIFINQKLEKTYKKLKNDDPLKKHISSAIKEINKNAFSGIQFPKRLIPKFYVKKYKINNLWKYDLPRGWRLLYTISPQNEVEIISAILDWFDHKNYENKFNY